MLLEPGARLDAYEVIRLLGAGGMGEVYRARDTRLHRDVAIKVMQSACAATPDRLRRFRQEALATAALNHPNILVVYDTGQSAAAPYVVTELLEGETLAERLTKGRLPLRKTVDCAVQIANGLAAAHAKGIVHRDLKPDNVFLTRDERIKILDFGLAKLTDPLPAFAESATATGTEAGTLLGTVGYMSPEQVRGEAADHRSDVFSLGALIYEMASGKCVFRRGTACDTMSAILHEDPPDLSARASVSPALDRIVKRCLEKNPEERFQSARDVSFALEALSSVGTSTGDTKIASEWTSRRVRLAWTVAAAALGAVCGATLSLALRHGPNEPIPSSAVRFSVLPFEHTTFASTETAAETPQLAVSPNGRYVVFAAGKRGERPRLWLRGLDSVALQELAGTDDASFPFWSP
jgi:eukaryotic-like serine/threonine-protein kinase